MPRERGERRRRRRRRRGSESPGTVTSGEERGEEGSSVAGHTRPCGRGQTAEETSATAATQNSYRVMWREKPVLPVVPTGLRIFQRSSPQSWRQSIYRETTE